MEPYLQHKDVGSHSFQFAHKGNGSTTRFCFNVMVGENPDFWKARLLMHGAEFCGVIHGVFEGDGAIDTLDGYRPFQVHLITGRSKFTFILHAKDEMELNIMCHEIGGVYSRPCLLPLEWRIRCFLLFLWKRRPTIRFRSPLDCF